MLRSLLVMAGLISTAAGCCGAFVETPVWSLSSDDELGVGYDSNLFARRGGEGDGFVDVTPDLILQRLNSLTNLKLTLAVKNTDYFDRTELNSWDPSLDLDIHYPYDEFVFPTEEFRVKADRSTVVDGDIGGRLREQSLSAAWDGNIYATEKTILQGRAELHEIDTLTSGFNNNDYGTAGLTAAYVANERLELGIGYDYEYSVSEPRDETLPWTDMQQNLISFRGRGDLLPKVSGNFYIGVAYTTFRGGYDENSADVQGGVSVVWTATEHGKLTLRAERKTYFSPNGYAYTPTSLSPEWTQELAERFSATVGADAVWTENRFTAGSRNDQAYGGHFSITNTITDHYQALLAFAYTHQTSTGYIYNYDRAVVTGSFTYKF